MLKFQTDMKGIKSFTFSVCQLPNNRGDLNAKKQKKYRKQLNHMQYYLFVESVSQRVDHVTNAHL